MSKTKNNEKIVWAGMLHEFRMKIGWLIFVAIISFLSTFDKKLEAGTIPLACFITWGILCLILSFKVVKKRK